MNFFYKWRLGDTEFAKDKGTVFSCFAGGGGSSMGYKLAGFDVLGCNEVDGKMMSIYEANLKPKYTYLEPIQDLKLRNDLPDELYRLSILDGSPPCSSFSMSGRRSKDWGKARNFKEGKYMQVLDTLFFDFIDLAQKLQPKVVVAENVKGLLMGDAVKYVAKIYHAFDAAGYYPQHFLLDASKMGVPQRRERVFFIALRKDLAKPFLKKHDLFLSKPNIELLFNEAPITFGEYRSEAGKNYTHTAAWRLVQNRLPSDKNIGDIFKRLHGKNNGFNAAIVHDGGVCPTITASERNWRHYDGHAFSDQDYIVSGSFPLDYYFGDTYPDYWIKHVIGMSVPPIMMAQIAKQIYSQWLYNISLTDERFELLF